MAEQETITTDTTREFLEALYGDVPADQRAYLWGLPSRETHWFGADAIGEAAEWARSTSEGGGEVYCGVGFTSAEAATKAGPRRRVVQRLDERDADSAAVTGVVGLVADIDIAGDGHKGAKCYPPFVDAALHLVRKLPHAPTVTIHSGGGLHCWWLFKEPWLFGDDDERRLAIGTFRGWGRVITRTARELGCDVDPVHDLARVLRVPGTLNHKGDAPRPVTVLEADWLRRYNPDDFSQYQEAITEAEVANGVTVSLSSELPWGKHQALCDNLPVYYETCEHKRRGWEGKSASEYDLALANYTVQAGWSDDEIGALIRWHQARFGTKPGKGERVSYIIETISKARQSYNSRRRTEASSETIVDSERTREERIAAIAEVLDVPIDDIVVVTGPPSLYRFLVDGKIISVPGPKLMEQHFVAGQILDLTGRHAIPVPNCTPKNASEGLFTWRNVVHAITEVAEEIQGDPDATEDGWMLSWIRGFCGVRQLREINAGTVIENPDIPFLRDEMLWFRVERLRAYMHSQGERVESSFLRQRLKGLRAESRVMKVRSGASKTGNSTNVFTGVPPPSCCGITLSLVPGVNAEIANASRGLPKP
jgi:hypothetical protein